MENHDKNDFIEMAEALYQALKGALNYCMQNQREALDRIECCFHKSVCYQSILNNKLRQHCFKKREEEVQFFKSIRPLFGAVVEYHALLYHLHVFITGSKRKDAVCFISRESNRLQKLIRQHSSFYHYYKSGSVFADDLYFSQPLCLQDKSREEGNKETMMGGNGYDEVLALIIAHERYHDYLKIVMKG